MAVSSNACGGQGFGNWTALFREALHDTDSLDEMPKPVTECWTKAVVAHAKASQHENSLSLLIGEKALESGARTSLELGLPGLVAAGVLMGLALWYRHSHAGEPEPQKAGEPNDTPGQPEVRPGTVSVPGATPTAPSTAQPGAPQQPSQGSDHQTGFDQTPRMQGDDDKDDKSLAESDGAKTAEQKESSDPDEPEFEPRTRADVDARIRSRAPDSLKPLDELTDEVLRHGAGKPEFPAELADRVKQAASKLVNLANEVNAAAKKGLPPSPAAKKALDEALGKFPSLLKRVLDTVSSQVRAVAQQASPQTHDGLVSPELQRWVSALDSIRETIKGLDPRLPDEHAMNLIYPMSLHTDISEVHLSVSQAATARLTLAAVQAFPDAARKLIEQYRNAMQELKNILFAGAPKFTLDPAKAGGSVKLTPEQSKLLSDRPFEMLKQHVANKSKLDALLKTLPADQRMVLESLASEFHLTALLAMETAGSEYATQALAKHFTQPAQMQEIWESFDLAKLPEITPPKKPGGPNGGNLPN